MYKQNPINRTTINKNDSIKGETLETKIQRRMENKEPLDGEAPLIYTEREQGVLAGYNIRTDRFEIALEGIDAIQRSRAAKREIKAQMQVVKNDDKTEPNNEQPKESGA